MKITVGVKTYTDIKAPNFAPQTDVTGSEVTLNDLEVDINTTDTIGIGQYLFLYDDQDNLWAKYWITYAEHIDKQTLRIKADSQLKLLERDILDPVMFSAEPIADVLTEIFASLGSSAYTIDSSFTNETITGFCPEQSAKTRLQWVCLVLGAYIQSFFSETINILPIDEETETLIPIEKTYWKPSVTYRDYVTAVNVKAYSYTQGTPATTDAWVTDNTNTYIQEEQNFKLSNPDAPVSVLTNEITVEGITIVNSTNVSAIASHLAKYYFKRQEVDLDVINNAEYIPGQRVVVYTDEDTLAVGFIESCAFSYGIQARSTIHMTPVEVRESEKLTVIYSYDGMQIGKIEYTLPVGYAFSIENPYLDMQLSRHRFIFRPTTAAATGTMVSGGVTVTVNYEIALDYIPGEGGTKLLHIVSVDDIAQDETDNTLVEIT